MPVIAAWLETARYRPCEPISWRLLRCPEQEPGSRQLAPHPDWSYQVAFEPALFAEIVPALALARGSLFVFIYPNTEDDFAAHRDHATWMGAVRLLDPPMFEK